MPAPYQHASDWIPGVPTPFSGVIRVADGKWIACAADSPEWEEYLTWAATDPANVPDPYLAPAAGGVTVVPAQDEVLYGAAVESLPPAGQPVMSTVPAVTVNDAIGTSAVVGDTLKCTMGEWEGEPTSYQYRWINELMTDLSAGDTYIVAGSDVDHSVCCVVTATNAGGSTTSAPSNAVAVAAPVEGTVETTGSRREYLKAEVEEPHRRSHHKKEEE
jgi:hypothetical protein